MSRGQHIKCWRKVSDQCKPFVSDNIVDSWDEALRHGTGRATGVERCCHQNDRDYEDTVASNDAHDDEKLERGCFTISRPLRGRSQNGLRPETSHPVDAERQHGDA